MIDLTNIAQSSDKPQDKEVVRPQSVSGENLKIPDNPQAREFRKYHWTIDKFVDDGQFKAGEVDKEHEEFLKDTTFVE